MSIRTQAELRARYEQAQQRNAVVEASEYDRCEDETESYKIIDATAKRFMGFLLRNIQRRRKAVQENIACFVAWKWMLGHRDADTFPGAHSKPDQYDPLTTYTYLREQITNGEWDRMTDNSRKKAIADSQKARRLCQNSAPIATESN